MELYNTPPVTTAELSEKPTIASTAVVRESLLGKWTAIGAQTSLEESSLDDYSYIDHHSILIYTDVGKFSNIASMVRINPGFHPLERPVMHHFTYRSKQYQLAEHDDETFFNWRAIQRVTIGHDTWIGHGAVIMPGITIGNGAVVGSNAVVTKDIPPYAIAVGAPAKVIRFRFPQTISDSLERIAWWEWDHQLLGQRLEDFKDLRMFILKYGNRQ